MWEGVGHKNNRVYEEQDKSEGRDDIFIFVLLKHKSLYHRHQ